MTESDKELRNRYKRNIRDFFKMAFAGIGFLALTNFFPDPEAPKSYEDLNQATNMVSFLERSKNRLRSFSVGQEVFFAMNKRIFHYSNTAAKLRNSSEVQEYFSELHANQISRGVGAGGGSLLLLVGLGMVFYNDERKQRLGN